MAANFSVGDRVVFQNARDQTQEIGTIIALTQRLPDATIIAKVRRDSTGQTLEIPVAGLTRA